MKPYLYFAAPLFSEAELVFNQSLAEELERTFNVYLPQRDGCLVVDLVRNFGIPWSEASSEVFERDIAAIRRCDLFLAVLDGRAPDEGLSFELGFACAIEKPCWGLKTDPRTLLEYGMNPMLFGGLEVVFDSRAALVNAAKKWAKEFDSVG